ELAIDDGTVDPDTGLSGAALEQLNEDLDAAIEIGVAGLPLEIDSLDSATVFLSALIDAAAAEGAPAGIAAIQSSAQTAVDDGSDPDGDGLSTSAESTITSQMAAASTATIPAQVAVVTLDPVNEASVGGEPDLVTATRVVGNLDSLKITLGVAADNQEKLLTAEQVGLEFLLDAQDAMTWSIDFEGVAEAMGVSVEEAIRAVGIFNANCARCHTAGYSAGVPYTQEVGSGGFGPALWDGRPLVQFGPAAELFKDDLLIQFLINGSVAETPYGLNGFGSGRMPAFGAILSVDDIELLAEYLRSGNLNGME
ncbi:MAG: cytochrome c, partial [Acidimicrobiia bacterium]|nr:cytochrome c [Acidimicrobiia bacterium]